MAIFQNNISKLLFSGLWWGLYCQISYGQHNFSQSAKIHASLSYNNTSAELAIDGQMTTAWVSENNKDSKWIIVTLPYIIEIEKVKIYMQSNDLKPIQNFALKTLLNGRWLNHVSKVDNQQNEVTMQIQPALVTDRIKLVVENNESVVVYELDVSKPALGFQVDLSINSVSSDFNPDHITPRILLLHSQALNPWLGLTTNWGVAWNGNDATPRGFYK